MARRGREDLSRWIPASLRQEALVQQALEGFDVVPRHRGRLMLSRRTATVASPGFGGGHGFPGVGFR
jgi:hypothetical protein